MQQPPDGLFVLWYSLKSIQTQNGSITNCQIGAVYGPA